jgi:hypothetical protein
MKSALIVKTFYNYYLNQDLKKNCKKRYKPIHYIIKNNMDIITELSPWCSEHLTLDELYIRRNFLKHNLYIHFKDAENMDNIIQSKDPYKFRGLQNYYQKRLDETEAFIDVYVSDLENNCKVT